MVLTRREVLAGAVAAGALLHRRAASAQPSQPATPVNFAVPAGACDCHTHIHGDPSVFPLFAGRVYTPEVALPEHMAALHKALRIQRVVIVTPSIYGTDNAATLYGMKARGNDARGVAVIDDKTTDAELDAMGRAGIRGIRLNLATAGINDPAVGRARFTAALARVTPRNWHIQINTNLAMISRDQGPGCGLARAGRVRSFRRRPRRAGCATTGLCRSDRTGPVGQGVHQDLRGRIARHRPRRIFPTSLRSPGRSIGANRERVLWGTDWPHPNPVPPPGGKATDVTPLLQIDDGRVLNLLPAWAPDPATRKMILVDNPARLYGF